MRYHILLSIVLASAFAVQAEVPGAVKLNEAGGVVNVEVGGKPFTTYHFADDLGGSYVRPYCFPVLAADGTCVTSDQLTLSRKQPADTPKNKKVDHPHHRSLWVAHGDVNGADHWSLLKNPPPRQRHVKFLQVEGDTIQQELAWEGPDYQPMLKEIRTLRFFEFADGNRGVDFTLVFSPTGGPVTFKDTKEAGLCSVRVAPSIAAKPTITNAAGQSGEKDAWGKPAIWCDESGQIDGRAYGVAILDHPLNPRYPSTWHVRAYGLMSANIFGLHDFDKKNTPEGAGNLTVDKGQTVTFRYRVVIHTGDAVAAKLDEKAREFAAAK